MLKLIDQSDTHLVQKITSPDGDVIRYQTVPIVDGKPMTITRLVNVYETRFAALMEAGLLTLDGCKSQKKRQKS